MFRNPAADRAIKNRANRFGISVNELIVRNIILFNFYLFNVNATIQMQYIRCTNYFVSQGKGIAL